MRESVESLLCDLALSRPGAARILHAHGLDYCFDGRRTLAEACRTGNLDAEGILAELQADDAATFIPLVERALGEVVDHVMIRFHGPLHRELRDLVTEVAELERRFGDHRDWPSGLVTCVRDLADDVENHMQKEEQVLFPLIRRGGGMRAAMSVRVLMQEHEDHADYLASVRRLTGDFSAPDAADARWRDLYGRLARLEADLIEHMHSENHALFARALQID